MARTQIQSEEGLIRLLVAIVRGTPKAERTEAWGWLAEVFEHDPVATRGALKPMRGVFHVPVDARRNNGRRRANCGDGESQFQKGEDRMTNEEVLDEQLNEWRRKLAEHEDALQSAGALAATGAVDQAARQIADATIGAQVARAAIAAIEGQRGAAVASDLLAQADRLDAQAAELDAQAAPIAAQVDGLIAQAALLGVHLVRRGPQADGALRQQAQHYRFEAAQLRRKAKA